jgi:hypothetical protein
MSERSRRFTDREVAMVLRKASELDESDGVEAGSGLSHRDLTEIAAEVGISAEAIDRAVAALDRGRDLGPTLTGAPLVRKAVHAVPAALREEDIARLIGLVDERTDAAGSVTEALGSVRWTSSDRFKSTRVSITPGETETSIEVVEKVTPRLRRVIHLIPPVWGLALAGAFTSGLQLSAIGAAAGVGLGIAGGLAAGRGAWNLLSRLSERRVKRLAEELADAGYDASEGSGRG